MKLIGLTGGVASGKSSAARFLRQEGAHVIDADVVAREVVQPGTDGLSQIVARFGETILDKDRCLDRTALGAIVIDNLHARKDLEAILHPQIQAGIARHVQKRYAAGDQAVFVEAALLVETGSAALYDALWVVRCDSTTQLARLMARKSCTKATAQAWIDAQLPTEEKVRHATLVIDNDGDLDALAAVVRQAWRTLNVAQPDRD
jgi:dephospho-CoA kinase